LIRYLSFRLLRAALTVFGVLTASFLLLHAGGSPSALMLPPSATAKDIAALDRSLGYDRPLPEQYVAFLQDAARGDFGRSVRQGAPAMSLVLERLPATAELALTSFGFGAGLAFVIAILIELTGNRAMRGAVFWIGLIRQAIPSFVFAVFLVALFAVTLHWLPSMGRAGWRNLVLPAITVGSFELTLYVRLLDSAFGEQRRLDYVRTAYAKGASRARVVLRHMLPNAVLPVMTVAGLNLGAMLGGIVIVETVFNWPGVGRLVIEAVNGRDFPVVQAGLLLVSVMFVAVNLLVDIVYAALDPRVALA
jgi:peptide/nickel transport system permease protein